MATEVEEYVVTGPYVTVKTLTPQGIRVVGLYDGAPLPADVPQKDLEHLLAQGLVHERGWVPPSPQDEAAARDADQAAAQLHNAQAELDKAQKAHDDAQAAVDRFARVQAEEEKARRAAEAARTAAAKAEAASTPPAARPPAGGTARAGAAKG